MSNKYIYFIIILGLGLVFLLSSCANIHGLTGGDKDITPPNDSIYSPENFNVNFSGNTFSILFDEYIKLNDINNQLIVSPPLDNRPVVITKQKTVFITIEDDLVPNTTYTFNFGEAIQDYTEGNPVKNLKYVFSTGGELDSLSIIGKCMDAYTNQPLENVKVMLYTEDVDSLPMTEKPFYFGLTNEQGFFEIDYMKPGDYKIFCLQDENADYLFQENESMGFIDSLITATKVDSLSQRLDISLSVQQSSKQLILDQYSDSTGFCVLDFAKRIDSLSFEILDLENPKFEFEEKDSVYFWITESAKKDSIFKLVVRDNEEVLDTLYLLYYPEEKLSIDWQKQKGMTTISKDSTFNIRTNHTYLKTLDTSLMELFVDDSVSVPFEINISDDSNRRIELNANFEENKTYKFIAYPAAITSLNAITNDTLISNFRTFSSTSLGSVKINISTDTSLKGILQLTDENDVLVFQESFVGNHYVEIDQLKPKKYSLRLIYDTNGNNRWDEGNYELKRQPESVIYYPENIEIKANWLLEYDWQVE